MHMNLSGDIFIHDNITSDAIVAALAQSLRFSLAQVGVRRPGTPLPADVEAIVTPWIEDLPGDWPCDYWLVLPDRMLNRVNDVLGTLAVELGLPVMTGADTDDPFIMHLFLPDGSVHEVPFLQDDDGGFRDTPEIARLIGAATPGVTSERQ